MKYVTAIAVFLAFVLVLEAWKGNQQSVPNKMSLEIPSEV